MVDDSTEVRLLLFSFDSDSFHHSFYYLLRRRQWEWGNPSRDTDDNVCYCELFSSFDFYESDLDLHADSKRNRKLQFFGQVVCQSH